MDASQPNQVEAALRNARAEDSMEKPRTKDDSQMESESIASALGGTDDNVNDIDDDGTPNDLEKAKTQTDHSIREPATRIVTAVDWTGPDDPGNPQNWPMWKKIYQTLAIGILAFGVTAGSSLITPATAEIAEHFQVSRTVAILSLTLYVLGLGLGPVLAAPISETFGRSIVYKVSAPCFMLFLVGAGFSKSLGSLLVCRLFAGLVGGPVLAVGAGTIADVFPPRLLAVASSIFVMWPFFGPALAPMIGGFVAYYKDWRWTQWVTIFIGIVGLILVAPMPETYKKVILSRRAKKHGVEGPKKPEMTKAQYIKLLLTITLLRPVHMLITEPIVLFLSLYNAFTFSVLFGYLAAYPYTFEKVYGFNLWQYGLCFSGILIGVLLGVLTSNIIDRKVYMKKLLQSMSEGKGKIPPEHRLYSSMIGAWGVSIGLFWFAWSARSDVHWISPVLAGIPFAWGNISIFISAALYLIDTYGPLLGASAMAANGLLRYSLGSVFPLFTFQMYETLGIAWATSLLGFIAVAMMPIPFVFFKYGPAIRARSGYKSTPM